MLKKLSTLLACAILTICAFGQTFTGYEVNKSVAIDLSNTFKDYKVYQLDLSDLTEYSKNTINESFLTLSLGDEYNWNLKIESSNLISDKYKLRYTTEKGIVEEKSSLYNKAFKGINLHPKGGETRLTIDYEFLHGWVEESGHRYYIEPLYYYQKDAPKDRIVVYHAEDALDTTKKTCGTTHEHDLRTEEQKTEQNKQMAQTKMVGDCFILEYALAGDFLMFQSHGSVVGVENHNIAVTNDVASDYDDSFSDEIQFLIVEQFVATSAATDPWTTSTNSGTLLTNFTNWGPTGFSQTHDLGGLWTDRDFDGSTIGVAWLNAVCGTNRYHTFQDFTGNANLKRVLASHEIGHNFSFSHDGGGTPCIMAPAVQNTTCWSTQSQNEFDSFIPTISGPSGCLAACPPPIPPVAGYSTNIAGSICAGSFLTFFDNSTNSPNSWSWSAPGAIPSTSNDPNPTFQFPNTGNFTVVLTASNAIGGDSFSQSINVSNSGGTDFFFFEDFENGAPTFTVENPDNNTTWTQASVNGTRQGNQAMFLDNFNYSAVGQRDALISPTLDFSGRTNTSLQLEYAYRRFNNNFADSLIVLISTNNGASFTRVFSGGENGSGNFATLDDSTDEFSPSAENNWCFGTTFGPGCLDIDLSAFDGATNVKIKIENFCGFGNSMFVDNLRLLSQCASFLPPVAAFSTNNTIGCAPMTVQYVDNSQNSPTAWNWSFPGGTPATSTQQNPLVTYNNPGTFSVTLFVSNSAGNNSSTIPNLITVEEEPSSNWSSSATDLSVSFNDQSIGTPTSWDWSFGDNSSSNQQNPTHTYDTDGDYLVTLTVSNICGSTAFTNVVSVISAPQAGFTSNITQGCASFLVNFSDNSSENTTGWQWSFEGGDPSTSTDPNPSVQYSVPGNYNVSLIASNSVGQNTVFESNYITVETTPSPAFSSNVIGQNVNFGNTSTNATSYSWDFGDNNSSGTASPNHTYASDGTYTVTLSATNNCGTETTTQTVVISTQPVAAFSAGATSGCLPFTVQFNNNSSENAQAYSWQFPGGSPATSTAMNPVVTYNTMGTFDVILTVSNAAGQNTSTETNYITVGDLPSVGYNNSTNGQVTTFTNTSVNATSFDWNFGDNTSSQEMNPVHDYGADGTYTVILNATNSCGTVSTTQTVVVATAPTASFNANATQGCTPLTVQFNNQSSENATDFMWTFDGGTPATSTDANPVVIYNTPGSFDVTLEVSNSVANSTSVQTDLIVVNTTPTVDFVSTSNNLVVDFDNTSSNATSYSWNFGDNTTSDEIAPTHTYGADGTYMVTLSATNECGTVTSTESVFVSSLPVPNFTADVTEGCAPFTVQFSDASSENAENWMWTFEGGTPATSTEVSPIVTFSTPGSYNVTLEVSNSAGGNMTTQMDYIIVNTTPTAAFTSAVSFANVDFTNEASGATSYLWDFGNTETSNEVSPNYTYPEDGTYTVSMTAINACGETTTTEQITILTPPTAGFTPNVTTGCAPMTVDFTNNSSDNATAFNWSFPGGEPAVSNEANPSITYANAGTYSVTLEVSNAAGDNTVTQSDIIIVNEAPMASISASNDLGTVAFTNGSTNYTSVSWDFGNMESSDEVAPTYTYTQEGTYTVTMSATNECGTTTATETINVVFPPSAGFSVASTVGCAPFEVTFNNQSSDNATNFQWEFEGAFPSTSTDFEPTVVYNVVGTYSVTLTVMNSAGEAVATETNYITVETTPSIDFTSTVDASDVQFTNNSTNATSYSWDFGDDSGSEEANPIHTYAEDGIYTVTLTATNDCGSVTSEENVAIATAAPLALFTTESGTSGCAPFEVTFNNQSSDNAESFAWTFEGGSPATSTATNPTIVFTNPGTYTVTLAATNIFGTNTYTETDYITVQDVPTAGFSTMVTSPAVQFENTSTGATSYAWTFGEGGMSDEENPSYEYDQNGTYTVTLVATNDCGSTTIIQEIEVLAIAPSPAFESDLREGCLPFTVEYQDLSTNNPDTWTWTFPGGTPATSTDQNPVVTYDTPGVYDATLSAANIAGSNSVTFTEYITVNDIPVVGFNFTMNLGQVIFENTSLYGTTFTWDFGDNSAGSNSADPVHTYTENGEYDVVLDVENECGMSSYKETITIVVNGVEDLPFIDELTLYPNPNNGAFSLTINGQMNSKEDLELSFFNIIGQRIYQETIQFNGSLNKVYSFDDLPAGMYLFEIRSGQNAIHKKVIVE